MVQFYLKDFRSLWLLAADLYVLTGVVYLNWNSERILYFYGLYVGLGILSYALYRVLLEGYSMLPSALMAASIIIYPLYLVIQALLIPPFFDFSLFFTLAVVAHVFDVKKYLRYDASVAQPGFGLYVAWLFLMLPALFILPKILAAFNLPMNVALIVSFISIRHFVEYKRYRKFLEIEKEIRLMADLEKGQATDN